MAIEAEAWEVYQQGYVACRTAPPYTPSGGGYHPDPLLEIPAGGIARVPAGHAQPIFLTLCIPRDTKPGTYTGRVSLSALRPEFSASVNVTVEVWDIVIPTLRDGVFEGTWTFGEPNFTRECSKRSAWVVTVAALTVRPLRRTVPDDTRLGPHGPGVQARADAGEAHPQTPLLFKLLQKRMMTVLMLSILSSDGAALQEFLSKWLADEPWQPYTAPAPGEF